jgi:hypothetical protein
LLELSVSPLPDHHHPLVALEQHEERAERHRDRERTLRARRRFGERAARAPQHESARAQRERVERGLAERAAAADRPEAMRRRRSRAGSGTR